MYALIGYRNASVPKVTIWGLYVTLEETKASNLIQYVKPDLRGIFYGKEHTLWIKHIELGDLYDWDISSDFMTSF